MDGLLASSLPGSCYPSPPAQFENGNWKSMLMELQFDVNDLDHSYDVYGRCLND